MREAGGQAWGRGNERGMTAGCEICRETPRKTSPRDAVDIGGRPHLLAHARELS